MVLGGALVLPALAVVVAIRGGVAVGRVVVAGAVFVALELGSLLLLFISALTCDENCEDPAEVWSDDPDAWQWDAIAVCAWVSLAAGAVSLFSLAYGRRRLAAYAFAVVVAAQAVAWGFAL